MNRRFFMRALAASLGFFGLGKFANAEPEFKYSKFFRSCDKATMDEFREFVCIDDNGKANKVPIIWATDEKAESFLKMSGVGLPLMNIYRGDLFFNDKICSYYHLTMRSMYEEHMNQMLEQAVVKFHPKFKNKIGEYSLMSMINNYYPGGSAASVVMRGEVFSGLKHGKQGYEQDSPIRVLRHQLNMILVIDGKP